MDGDTAVAVEQHAADQSEARALLSTCNGGSECDCRPYERAERRWSQHDSLFLWPWTRTRQSIVGTAQWPAAGHRVWMTAVRMAGRTQRYSRSAPIRRRGRALDGKLEVSMRSLGREELFAYNITNRKNGCNSIWRSQQLPVRVRRRSPKRCGPLRTSSPAIGFISPFLRTARLLCA
jgi:hypothetical protein